MMELTARSKQVATGPLPKAPRIVEVEKRKDGEHVAKLRPKTMRRWVLFLSFLLFVALPAAVGTYYYVVVATDRYAASAGFSVRGLDSGGALDGIGSLTGLVSSGSTSSDSHIILKYLSSRDILERLQKDFDVRSSFSHTDIDPISRLAPDASIEKLVDYWDSMISSSFDSTSGLIDFEVQAYSAGDAHRIAELVLQYTQDLINAMSENARADSVRFAESEVKLSEQRLLEALSNISAFRTREGSIDPAASAQLDIARISSLESRLVDIRTRIQAISNSVDADAPSMVMLRTQEKALQEQISQQTIRIGSSSEGRLKTSATSQQLEVYQTLEVEKSFAEQAYASAMASLEKARIDADRQQRYLAIYSAPALPQDAIYPRRAVNISLLLFVLFSIWGICVLIVYSVLDHLS